MTTPRKNKPKPKAEFLHVRVSGNLKTRVKGAAARLGVSESTYIRLKLAEAFGLSKEAAIAEIAR